MNPKWIVIFIIALATTSTVTVNAGGGLLKERFQLLKGAPVLVVVGRQAADSDYECALLVRDYLEDMNITVEIVYDDTVSEVELKYNLIVIGGPAVNKIASNLNYKISSWFERGIEGWILYVVGWRLSQPSHGVVNFEENPFGNSTYVVLLAGVGREGTIAATHIFLKAEGLWGEVAAVRLSGNVASVLFCSAALCNQQKEYFFAKPPEGPGVIYVVIGSEAGG